MNRRELLQMLSALGLLPAANVVAANWAVAFHNKEDGMQSDSTVYELREYHALPGKLPDLLARFREHTIALFALHGMKTLAFWTPTDDPLKANVLVYILVHPSRDAAAANWKSFQADPEWVRVRDKSEENGKLVDKIDSTYMALTEFSPKVG